MAGVSTSPGTAPRRGRTGRPPKGSPVLTRERIGRTVLDLATEHGVDGVSMRALAARLEVTVRALYKVVRDRDDALGAAAALAQRDWTVPPLDPARWERDLELLCADLLAWYRRYPVLLRLIVHAPVDEEIAAAALRNTDAALGFLIGAGLSPALAVRGWELVVGVVAGFAEIEAWERSWSGRAPDLRTEPEAPFAVALPASVADLPHLRAVAGERPGTPDERFGDLVEMLTGWIARRRE